MIDPVEIEWLLFFYSVPSKPVKNRMKIWRRLQKAGALPFKGAVYILPHREEYYELCQWLVSEAEALGGEAAFVCVKKIETMPNREILALFNKLRERDYQTIEKRLDDLEVKIENLKKGGKGYNKKKIAESLYRLSKDFENLRKIDFFGSERGTHLAERLQKIKKDLEKIEDLYETPQPTLIKPQDIKNYQGKIWVTRKKPFVDRMASAWLIKRFIDPEATFEFIDEQALPKRNKDKITFDLVGGDFTHIGDLCTFEVLTKAFNLKDKKLKKMAALVHELDIKDEKYRTDEAKGLEKILLGIVRTSKDDLEALERGMEIFELLYQSIE